MSTNESEKKGDAKGGKAEQANDAPAPTQQLIVVPDDPSEPNGKRMGVTADYFLPQLKKLQGEHRKKADMIEMIEKMKRVGSVHMRESSPEARSLYMTFTATFDEYLHDHPRVAALVDPVYVIVASFAPGVAAPPAWPPAHPFLPAGPAPIGGPAQANHAWSFANGFDAGGFIGVIRLRFPDIRTMMLTTNVPVVYD